MTPDVGSLVTAELARLLALLHADQLHHPQIDADETPQLPRNKRPHEQRESRWLRRVDIRVDVSHSLHVPFDGFTRRSAAWLLRNQSPSRAHLCLVKKHVMQHQLDPMTCQPNLSGRVL